MRPQNCHFLVKCPLSLPMSYLSFPPYQVVPLPPDVLKEREHVDVPPGLDLPHHGVQDDVAARAANAGAVTDMRKHSIEVATMTKSKVATKFNRKLTRSSSYDACDKHNFPQVIDVGTTTDKKFENCIFGAAVLVPNIPTEITCSNYRSRNDNKIQ